jgi:hypothetical protein
MSQTGPVDVPHSSSLLSPHCVHIATSPRQTGVGVVQVVMSQKPPSVPMSRGVTPPSLVRGMQTPLVHVSRIEHACVASHAA